MANNKNNSQGGSMASNESGQDRESENPSQDKGYGKSGQGQPAAGSQSEDDEINTAGGREGQFSDSKRGEEGQWSPGSTADQ